MCKYSDRILATMLIIYCLLSYVANYFVLIWWIKPLSCLINNGPKMTSAEAFGLWCLSPITLIINLILLFLYWFYDVVIVVWF